MYSLSIFSSTSSGGYRRGGVEPHTPTPVSFKYCCVPFHRGATGLSAVCDFGISSSDSPTI